jgi:hypothetical protein
VGNGVQRECAEERAKLASGRTNPTFEGRGPWAFQTSVRRSHRLPLETQSQLKLVFLLALSAASSAPDDRKQHGVVLPSG